MAVPSQVRALALVDLPAVALEAGIDPYPALREAGIDPDTLHRPDLTLSADRVAWMLDTMAERADIADLGIRIAMRRRLANLGVIGLVLAQQPTVRDALAMTQKYRHLLNDAMTIHIEESRETATLFMGVSIGSSAPARQLRELALSTNIHLFRLLLGEQWSPLRIHFSHSAPKGPTLHRRFFGCPVHFSSSFDGFESHSTDLDRVNANADTAIAGYAVALLDTLPTQKGSETTSLVARLIHALLPMGRASIDHVARAMSRNVRTLQRELAREGTEFSDLVADTRAKLAVEMLRDGPQPVKEIAERLGYSHPAAFIRFFRSRFGISPGEWRKESPSG
jgi:AraC-like DNA-binding protein